MIYNGNTYFLVLKFDVDVWIVIYTNFHLNIVEGITTSDDL